jgi:phage shock protein A
MYDHLSQETLVAMLEAEGMAREAVEHKLDVVGDVVAELVETIEAKDEHAEYLNDEIAELYTTLELTRAELRVMKAKYYSQPIITEDAGHGIPLIDFVLVGE